MATNLALDDKLIEPAGRAGGHKTKKAAVRVSDGRGRRRSRAHDLVLDHAIWV